MTAVLWNFFRSDGQTPKPIPKTFGFIRYLQKTLLLFKNQFIPTEVVEKHPIHIAAIEVH